MAKTIDSRLPGVLLPWYDGVKRALPWRENREPYRVWLSEIMLQQTRVEAVKGYFARFLEKLPDIPSLAACDDETLHKLWEGLGYYSRVRNLKKAAITIMEDYGGSFPREYESVRALPGIGDYTAGAICSICFDLPTPAVDGNVLRVAARLTEDFTPIDQPAVKKEVGAALAAIYPQRAGDFTQALMELGATLCGPNRKPDCDACPCREFCQACQNGTAEQLPIKTPKKQRRVEEKTVLILSCEGRYALTKRHDGGLLAGLWQFPDFPGQPELPAVLEKVEELGLKPREIYKQVEKKHIFTHVEWHMNGYYLEVAEPEGPFTWLTAEEMDAQAAMPTAYRQFRE